jgi:CheY-like chemotaxis protein
MAKRILVIDDEGMITKTVGGLLKRAGYITDVAKSGPEAIKKSKKSNFDLIIADIRMPQMDGIETISHIREHLRSNKKSDIPVIFITGYADSDAHIKAEKFGKIIFKPFDIKEFLED